MKSAIVVMGIGLVLGGPGRAGAESTGRVYHAVGPAIFTNAAAWGYGDGQAAGTNFVCGVYAGTDTNALGPCFGPPGSYLKRLLSSGGGTLLWGTMVVDGPAGAEVWMQFRAWPAEFATYEEAVASSIPSPPVGASQVLPALPPNLIVELPLAGGWFWVSPLVTAGHPLARLGCALAPGSAMVWWPTNAMGFTLVAADAPAANADWNPVGGTVEVSNRQNRVVVPVTNASRFFRLRR